jgi:16S rRNA pseudouridine516 synthase
MRLDKFLCEARGVSRSIAGNMVKRRRVYVNDTCAASPSIKIKPNEDTITLDGKPVNATIGFRYFIMHKPAGLVCANQDSEHPIVFDLMKDTLNLKTLHTVGRLDIDTTGLLLITDDGKWSHILTAPKNHHDKTYRVWLTEPLADDAEEQCLTGLLLHNELNITKPAILKRINDTEVLLTISEGRYHQVKRMFAALGNHVVKLHRESISGIQLDPTLAAGEYRELNPSERQTLGIKD